MATKQPQSLMTSLSYAAPYLAGNWLFAPMALLQGIYAKYYGLSLTNIALLILIIRFSDVFTDPLVGYCSDRYFQRKGSRKPFVFFGGLLLALAGYCLYSPINLLTLQPLSTVSEEYFLFWSLVFFLGWTFFDMAHMAWGNDLSPSAQDKTQLYSYRAAAVYTGLIMFYMVPFLPVFDSRDITPEVLRFSAVLAVILMVVCLYICLLMTPKRYMPAVSLKSEEKKIGANTPLTDLPTAPEKTDRISSKQLCVFLRSLLDNKPLLLIVGAILLKYIGAGMFAGLLFIYVDVYLNLGHHFALMMILGFVGSLVSIPIWKRLANAFGKKATWMLAMTLALIGFIYFGALSPESQFYHLIIANSLISAGAACTWSVTTAMYAEVVDYSNWKYRVERTATYFSLYTLMGKLTGSLSISLGLGIAGWYGLDATATTHSEQAVWGLKLAMSWIPVVFTLFALVFIALFPIDDHRHRIIRRRLDQRATRRLSALTPVAKNDSLEAAAITT